MTTDQVRRRWPEVLETLAQLKRTTWALVSQDAQVVHLTESTLSLGFSTEGLATAFRSGPHASFVGQALRETLGLEVQIQRSEEHTSELQSRGHLVCRLLLEKKNQPHTQHH